MKIKLIIGALLLASASFMFGQGQFAGGGGGGTGVSANAPNTWTAVQTHTADIVFSPVGGPNLIVNRVISTSANAPLNGCSFCGGPSDSFVYGCVSCDSSKTLAGFISSNGLVTMNVFKPHGSSAPVDVCDYLGCRLGFSNLTGAQQIGSGIAGNSDFVGELAFAGVTTASYTWVNAPGTVGAYAIHPECFLQPQFDYSTNRFWPTYTGAPPTSFTINFSAAVTGNVSYTCHYRN